MSKPPRPTGVSILAILNLLVGILLVLGGVLIAAVSGSGLLSSLGYGVLAGVAEGIGGLFGILGLLALLQGWGMWTGKGWAWTLAVVLYAVDVLFDLLSLVGGALTSVVGLLIGVFVLWYMFRPHVKSYFGRGQPQMAPVTSTPPVPPPSGV